MKSNKYRNIKNVVMVWLALVACVLNPVCAEAITCTEMDAVIQDVRQDKIIREEMLSQDSFIYELQMNPDALVEKFDNVVSVKQEVVEQDFADKLIECSYISETDEDFLFEYEANLTTLEYKTDMSNKNISTFYVLSATGTTKTSTDKYSSNGVTLSGCIGWVDNTGIQNEFKYVSGSRSGSYSGQGFYNAKNHTVPLCSGYFDTSFYSTSNATNQTGLQFDLLIRTNDTSGGKVELLIKTSMLD